MDPDLEDLIRRTLAGAEAHGKDYLTQTEEAVRAVRQARPNMTAPDALSMVQLVRRQWDDEGTDGRTSEHSAAGGFLKEDDPSLQ